MGNLLHEGYGLIIEEEKRIAGDFIEKNQHHPTKSICYFFTS